MRILHALHDFLPRHRAGSEIYVERLAKTQAARGHEVHVLCAEADPGRCHGSLRWRWHDGLPVTELVNHWQFASFEETYLSAELGRSLDAVLQAVAPDVLHVHNLLNLTFELPAIAATRGIPAVGTLHDYTLVCPSGGQRVHRAESHVCVVIEPERCARCFAQSAFSQQMTFARLSGRRGHGLARRLAAPLRAALPRVFAGLGRAATRASQAPLEVAEVERRLARARRVFAEVESWVAPSPSLAAEYRRLGMPHERIEVSDYGFEPLPRRPRPATPETLRLGFVGTVGWHKGVHLLLDAVRRLPADGWALTIWGSLDTFPDYVADLRALARGLPVRFAGGFGDGQAAEIYAGFDVLVVPSLWPENSPLVIHEAFQSGVAVVGARMGGVADLIRHDVDGLLYDAFSAEALASALRPLLAAPEEVRRLVAAAPRVKTLDEDAAEWDDRYRRALATTAKG